MKIEKIILGIVAVTLLSAGPAFAQKVTYNFMPGIDFTHYKTYKWQRLEKGDYPNQLLDEQIRRSIDMQMRSKGLMRDDSGIPELVLIYQAAVSQDKEWTSYSTGGGYWGWGGWGGWGGMGSTNTYSRTITTGSLNVDIYDVLTKKQIWRGEVTKTIKTQKDPVKLQKNLDKATAKLMKNFPPPQKK